MTRPRKNSMWTTCMFLCWLVNSMHSPVEEPWGLGCYRDLSMVDLDGETRSIQPGQAMIVVMITEIAPSPMPTSQKYVAYRPWQIDLGYLRIAR